MKDFIKIENEEKEVITMTPLDLVRQWTERLPGCYEQLDELREVGVFWPDYCVLPINAACSYSEKQKLIKPPELRVFLSSTEMEKLS